MKINKDDLTYTYNTRGYMLYYKTRPLGGAGTKPDYNSPRKGNWRTKQADLKMYKEMAQREIDNILSGHGAKRYIDVIKKIMKEMNIKEQIKFKSNPLTGIQQFVFIVYNEGHDIYTDFMRCTLSTAKSRCNKVVSGLKQLLPKGTWSAGLVDYNKYVKKGDDYPFYLK